MLTLLAVVFGILGIFLLAVIIGLIYRQITVVNAKVYKSEKRLDGKTVLITGTTAGIGKAAAFDFANRGARLIMGCRNATKAKEVADEISTATGNSNIIVHQLDTSKLTSAREFSQKILNTENRIDILVLNAGITGFNDYRQTEDGIELTMATNHFGHFLILNLLLGLLVESAPSKILFVASRMHLTVRNVDVQNLAIRERGFGRSNPYGLSKLCNITTSAYLAPILEKHNVTINSMGPGLVGTEIFDKGTTWFSSYFLGFLTNFFARSPQQGAATLLYLAMDDVVKDVTGKFYFDNKVGPSTSLAKNKEIINGIWEKSEEIVHLTEDEKSFLNKLKSEL